MLSSQQQLQDELSAGAASPADSRAASQYVRLKGAVSAKNAFLEAGRQLGGVAVLPWPRLEQQRGRGARSTYPPPAPLLHRKGSFVPRFYTLPKKLAAIKPPLPAPAPALAQPIEAASKITSVSCASLRPACFRRDKRVNGGCAGTAGPAGPCVGHKPGAARQVWVWKGLSRERYINFLKKSAAGQHSEVTANVFV